MDIKYIFIKTKDNTDCMNNKNSKIRNIGAEYVNTRHNIGFKLVILPKRTTFISNQTGCPCRIQI
jgi:hypothetical protein